MDLGSWNMMVAWLLQHGYSGEVLKLFYKLQQESVEPNRDTVIHALKACSSLGDLVLGKKVHSIIMKNRFESDLFVETTLIHMYANCGSVTDARQVFDKMFKRSIASWNVMISGYAHHGQGKEALNIYHQMLLEGIRPDRVTFFGALKACAAISNLQHGKQIHMDIMNSGYDSDIGVGTSLIGMYSRCGSLVDARRVFDKMKWPNLVSWNVMITCYAHNGHGEEAFKLFWKMQEKNVNPDRITFFGLLKACCSMVDLEQGKQIHAYIIECGLEADTFVSSNLIDMYAKCGSLEDAQSVFDKMSKPAVASWNALIAGYAQHGLGKEAFQLFQEMEEKHVKPDSLTFISLLNACGSMEILEFGKQIHTLIIENGFEADTHVGNMLIDMYAKCGSLEDAHDVFDKMPKRSVVSWNALISGYAQKDHGEEALKMFWQMQLEGVQPDKYTCASSLKACASLADLKQGKKIHNYIIEKGCEVDVFVGTALIDMYAKCKAFKDACEVLEKTPKCNVVSWNAMIAGYVQHGYGEDAFVIFWKMKQEGVKPDIVTFLALLKACSSLGALECGKQIHNYIIEHGCESHISVGNTLIDMYSKCGSVTDARDVFDKMIERSVVTWNVMIAGYAQYGYSKESLDVYWLMQQECVKPDQVTFLGVLSACSHAGLIVEGCQHFNAMIQYYDIFPAEEHYTCMVDLLSRAGYLEEAHVFIKKMPLEPAVSAWMALLGSCRIHANVETAKHIRDFVLKLEPENLSACVLISNVYAKAGKWHEKANMRKPVEMKPSKLAAIKWYNQDHALLV